MEDPDVIRARINQWAAEDNERARKAKKYGKSSDSGDGELLGALIVFTGYAVYQGAKVLGKAAIDGGKVAVKGSKIADQTAANAYKLHKGDIEIVSQDKDGNIMKVLRDKELSRELQEGYFFGKICV
ncbi:hypothetical protein [Rickettsia asembonensis]|uniref:hypothetical protein n=1 Tax=Rickettsia asembonensis TaxID=1068590 RepID=UPI0023F69DB3|nr:hypothetical protein [Rickettsia asembonensis]WCR56613.1 MAG: hypothetical protein PG979_000670 [Rickettsia asembonensis]